jgi:hypothetical protein
MVPLSVHQCTELFHLVFLRALVAKGEDKGLVALISFDDYTSRVVAFLEPRHAEIYADRSAWEAMQEDVVTRLEALR